MAIPVPVKQTMVDADIWGKPITDEVNRMTPLVTAQSARLRCKVKSNVSQSIPNTTVTVFNFAAVEFDPSALWVAGQPTRIALSRIGVWAIGWQCTWDTTAATGGRGNWLRLGGSTSDRLAQFEHGVVSGGYVTFSSSSIINIAATTYLEMAGYQTSGGALNATNPAFMWATWLGD